MTPQPWLFNAELFPPATWLAGGLLCPAPGHLVQIWLSQLRY